MEVPCLSISSPNTITSCVEDLLFYVNICCVILYCTYSNFVNLYNNKFVIMYEYNKFFIDTYINKLNCYNVVHYGIAANVRIFCSINSHGQPLDSRLPFGKTL